MFQPIKCSKCGSNGVREIIYGYISKDEVILDERSDVKNVTYGGCIIHDDSSKYECNNCGHTFGKLND